MTEIDLDRQRFLVSLKPSECFPDETAESSGRTASGVELLENYLLERQKILHQLAASSGIFKSGKSVHCFGVFRKMNGCKRDST